MTNPPQERTSLSSSDAVRRRMYVFAIAAVVAGLDIGAKVWAEHSLPAGGLDGGPIDLRIAYNDGVAFSIGGNVPMAVVVAVTATITAVIAVVAWRLAPAAARDRIAALALVLGGATANLVDRAGDGVVTDYFHTGWWPTFNLADVAIVVGCGLLVLASLRAPRQ
ncbi:MAG: signal peptidase [Frankiales bacterium]|jgi:signal peptidase II|nr:signal peptidase [Frankiales bacterium]